MINEINFIFNISAGIDNFLDDTEFMVGSRPSIYWRFCWCFLTPLTLFSILIYFLIDLTPIQYNGEYYPTSAYGTINSTRINRNYLFHFKKKEKKEMKNPCSIRIKE